MPRSQWRQASGLFAGSGVGSFETDFARRYPVQTAGDRSHEELWVPSDELGEFNRHIVGRIAVIEAFPGPRFPGDIDSATNLPVGFSPAP